MEPLAVSRKDRSNDQSHQRSGRPHGVRTPQQWEPGYGQKPCGSHPHRALLERPGLQDGSSGGGGRVFFGIQGAGFRNAG